MSETIKENLKWYRMCNYFSSIFNINELRQIAKGEIPNYENMNKKELCEAISRRYVELDFWMTLFPEGIGYNGELKQELYKKICRRKCQLCMDNGDEFKLQIELSVTDNNLKFSLKDDFKVKDYYRGSSIFVVYPLVNILSVVDNDVNENSFKSDLHSALLIWDTKRNMLFYYDSLYNTESNIFKALFNFVEESIVKNFRGASLYHSKINNTGIQSVFDKNGNENNLCFMFCLYFLDKFLKNAQGQPGETYDEILEYMNFYNNDFIEDFYFFIKRLVQDNKELFRHEKYSKILLE